MAAEITPNIAKRGDDVIMTFPARDEPFATSAAAERYLQERGFSVGRRQNGSPRGVLFGDFDIQKWRNLRRADLEALHGTMTGNGRNGPIEVRIRADAPLQARESALKQMAERETV